MWIFSSKIVRSLSQRLPELLLCSNHTAACTRTKRAKKKRACLEQAYFRPQTFTWLLLCRLWFESTLLFVPHFTDLNTKTGQSSSVNIHNVYVLPPSKTILLPGLYFLHHSVVLFWNFRRWLMGTKTMTTPWRIPGLRLMWAMSISLLYRHLFTTQLKCHSTVLLVEIMTLQNLTTADGIILVCLFKAHLSFKQTDNFY